MSLGALTVFHDELQVSSTEEQQQLRQQYEAQIAGLHREMDAIVSRNLVAQQELTAQVAELVNRQGSLAEQQRLLTGLANDALAAGIDVLPALAPLPIANPLRQGIMEPGGIGGPANPAADNPAIDINAGIDPGETLQAVAMAADRLEESQRDALMRLANEVADRSTTLAGALDDLGFPIGGDTGGPFVPDEGTIDFDLVEAELGDFARLQDYARSLPIGMPLTVIDISSTYGRRTDPFTGQAAVHTGLDMRAATGTPVYVTAAGTVVNASRNGGYGNMVEVDHGNGIITAYAHLSAISVRVGQEVAMGAIVGRAGSTGRSTGPHLHYEVLRDGRTTDPLPYVRTGQEIAGLL